MAKTDEIVLIGGQDRTTAEISKLCGTLPPAVQALTGVDITGVGTHGHGAALPLVGINESNFKLSQTLYQLTSLGNVTKGELRIGASDGI